MIRFLQQDSRVVKGIFIGLISVVAILMVITLVPGIFQDSPSDSNNFAVVHSDSTFGRFLGVRQMFRSRKCNRWRSGCSSSSACRTS